MREGIIPEDRMLNKDGYRYWLIVTGYSPNKCPPVKSRDRH